jgi:hypothetical protein
MHQHQKAREISLSRLPLSQKQNKQTIKRLIACISAVTSIRTLNMTLPCSGVRGHRRLSRQHDEIEHPANRLDPGPMRVAANDDVNPARDWIELQCLDVVQDIDAAPAEGYHLGLRILLRPVAGIDVPSNRNDRRNPLESGDNVRRTDVAGMDNMRHACEALLDLRTQEPVSVRDDSNSTRPL